MFVFAKYVSTDLVLATNFGLLAPLLYPPLTTFLESVLDGDDEDDADLVPADTEEDVKYVAEVDPHEFVDVVRFRIQHDRLIVFRLDDE